MNRHSFLLTLLVALILPSCSLREATSSSPEVPVIFPDYVGVTVPCNIAPLNFQVEGATYVRADFALGSQALVNGVGTQALGSVGGSGSSIDIPLSDWHKWLSLARGSQLSITVSAWDEQHPSGMTYAPFTVNVSNDSIDPYVAYRLIEPGYESWQDIGIYQRELSSFDESVIVCNKENNGGCLNCHSFRGASPDQMLFHARGEGGGTIFWKGGKCWKVDLKQSNLGMQGVYPMWHPEGRFVAFSTNKTSQSFYSGGRTPIEVYDMASDIFIYDTETGEELADPRFRGTAHLETFPAFSPDGQWLYFCSADSVNLDTEFRELRYSILRVPFNAKDGTLGATIDTLYNAHVDGHSASFPRISPDGRWLLYTQSDFATFPIWHREADLKLIPLDGADGTSRTDAIAESVEATEVITNNADLSGVVAKAESIINSPETESYHSFSTSGRWIVFSSRRIDSRYTRLFFAHFDADGQVTKPFLLPQHDPSENVYRLKSYNVPEFLLGKATISRSDVADLF